MGAGGACASFPAHSPACTEAAYSSSSLDGLAPGDAAAAADIAASAAAARRALPAFVVEGGTASARPKLSLVRAGSALCSGSCLTYPNTWMAKRPSREGNTWT